MTESWVDCGCHDGELHYCKYAFKNPYKAVKKFLNEHADAITYPGPIDRSCRFMLFLGAMLHIAAPEEFPMLFRWAERFLSGSMHLLDSLPWNDRTKLRVVMQGEEGEGEEEDVIHWGCCSI